MAMGSSRSLSLLHAHSIQVRTHMWMHARTHLYKYLAGLTHTSKEKPATFCIKHLCVATTIDGGNHYDDAFFACLSFIRLFVSLVHRRCCRHTATVVAIIVVTILTCWQSKIIKQNPKMLHKVLFQ